MAVLSVKYALKLTCYQWDKYREKEGSWPGIENLSLQSEDPPYPRTCYLDSTVPVLEAYLYSRCLRASSKLIDQLSQLTGTLLR